MTVGELIEKLKKYPEDWIVQTFNGEYMCEDPFHEVTGFEGYVNID